MVMLADGAVPSDTAAVPSLMVTYHWPPLSPLRLNWIVAFTPFAALASSWPGISLKISAGVIRTLLLLEVGGLSGLGRLAGPSLSRYGRVAGARQRGEELPRQLGRLAGLVVLQEHVHLTPLGHGAQPRRPPRQVL